MERRHTGDIGEYYVLYRLVQEGLLASLAPKTNTKTDEEPHDIFILPSQDMARVVRTSYEAHLQIPGRGGREKQRASDPNAERRIYEKFPPGQYGEMPDYPPNWLESYRERWNVLLESDM